MEGLMKKYTKLILILICLTYNFMGCESSDDGSPSNSSFICDMINISSQGNEGKCISNDGPADVVSLAEVLCTYVGGSSVQACTSTNLVGTCTVVDSASYTSTLTTVTKYYSPTYDVGTAEADCTTEGGSFQ